jgi:hypothetical protein
MKSDSEIDDMVDITIKKLRFGFSNNIAVKLSHPKKCHQYSTGFRMMQHQGYAKVTWHLWCYLTVTGFAKIFSCGVASNFGWCNQIFWILAGHNSTYRD